MQPAVCHQGASQCLRVNERTQLWLLPPPSLPPPLPGIGSWVSQVLMAPVGLPLRRNSPGDVDGGTLNSTPCRYTLRHHSWSEGNVTLKTPERSEPAGHSDSILQFLNMEF